MKQVHWRYLLVAGILVVCAATCGCTTSFFNPGPAAEYPVIGPYEDDGRIATSSMEFPFQERTVSISVNVSKSLYDAASGADKNAVLLGEWKEDDDWTTGYYLSFTNSPEMEQVYSVTAKTLKEEASTVAEDSDQYLEYLTVYVQSLAYDVSPDAAGPKFPVETVIDTAGDCDDKSILLAGLLAREGFNVSLFYFPGDSHMAVGVAADEPGYRDSGYLFIETTNLSLIGIPTKNFENGATLTADLFVIPVGNGTKEYGSADETRRIDRAAGVARARAEEEEAALILMEEDLDAMKRALDKENSALLQLKDSGDISGYNAAVADYNLHATEYNRALDDYRTCYDDYLSDVEFFNYVATHLYDRPGLSEKVADWERGRA
ncbi:hypothetical protein [Methanogenium organophilum]|uniref:Transglutaminase-like domain-containing protein n=1 Tax=Methanogenium organophilum TaxID=2199 RepID=A0A9X9S1U9_METOG|nr:hypothetical protein [Methanogenium organophilum]WAI00302.1 hypothetical protein OU421_07620 [Methanogenium organophilum]